MNIPSERVQTLVQRLKNTKEEFIFFNHEKTIKFIMATYKTINDFSDDDEQGQEYSMVRVCYAENNPENIHSILSTLLDIPPLTEEEQEEIDVDFSSRLIYEGDPTTPHELEQLTHSLSICFQMTPCECGKYFIYDTHTLCFLCELTKKDIPLEDLQECTICARNIHKDDFTKTRCCQRDLCNTCHGRLSTCCFCRKTL